MICGSKHFIVLLLLVIPPVVLSGCDTLSDYFQNVTESQNEAEESTLSNSYEKERLFEILEQQSQLLDEIQYAQSNGDKVRIKEAYEELILLDQSYQNEFEQYKEALSSTDALEISRQHQDFIKRLPHFSDLMR